MSEVTLIRRHVKLQHAQGLHLRVCSQVVALVNTFEGQVRIHFNSRSADANSMFDLMQLVAPPGSDLVLEGSGDGVEPILDALEQLFAGDPETPDSTAHPGDSGMDADAAG